MYNRSEILNQASQRREERRPNVNKAGYYVMPKRTENTTEELKIYFVLEKDFLKDNTLCQCGRPGCTRKATEVHHKKGRGKWLNVVKFFLAVCRACHKWIEEHPAEAKRLRLSLSRLAK